MEKKYTLNYQEIDDTKDRRQKEKYWMTGFGLNKIDHLEPSDYLTKELLPKHFSGKLSYNEVEHALITHYESVDQDDRSRHERECDLVSTRIATLLDNSGFVFSPATLKGIHRYLFKDVLPDEWVGVFREKNIYKKEPILNGETVTYANYFMIEDTLSYDFSMERKKSYAGKENNEIVQAIADFTSSIWQVHPFREGNTCTIAVFMAQYLNGLGFQINNDPFEENALYFRNALVRANYSSQVENISHTDAFLVKFFENLLLDTKHPLLNQEMQLNSEAEKEPDWEPEI